MSWGNRIEEVERVGSRSRSRSRHKICKARRGRCIKPYSRPNRSDRGSARGSDDIDGLVKLYINLNCFTNSVVHLLAR